jgi:hypothetical protein
MAPLLRSDVMRSYGISGYFESVRLVERLTPSRFKVVSIWTGHVCVSILLIIENETPPVVPHLSCFYTCRVQILNGIRTSQKV